MKHLIKIKESIITNITDEILIDFSNELKSNSIVKYNRYQDRTYLLIEGNGDYIYKAKILYPFCSEFDSVDLTQAKKGDVIGGFVIDRPINAVKLIKESATATNLTIKIVVVYL